MKCPSCHARLDPDASECPHCGHQFDEPTPKSTVMGMPAIGDEEDEGEGGDKTRSTLFGVPAAGGGDPEGLEEKTAPPSVDQESISEMDASTRVASDIDLDEVLDDGASGNQQAEQKPEDDDEADRVADAWGLESKEDASHDATKVADASIADSFAREQHDEFQEAPSTDAPETGKTLMGVGHDELADEQSTGGAIRDGAVVDGEQEEPLDAPTASIDADRVAELDRQDRTEGGPNRRREILEKLHSKVSEVTDEAESDASDAAKGRQAPAKENSQQSASPENRPPSGPRFEIPDTDRRGDEGSGQGPEELPVEAVEPVESNPPPSAGEPGDELEGQDFGATNFPVAETPSDAEVSSGIREFTDEDVGDVDGGGADADGSIRAFTDEDDDGEPIFPIDRDEGSAGRQVDLDQEASPHIEIEAQQQPRAGTPAVEVEDDAEASKGADRGQAAPSADSQPDRRPLEDQLPASPLETAQVGDGHPAKRAAQPRDNESAPNAPERTGGDSTKKVVHLIQTIIALLAGLFLIGAGGYGVAVGGLPEGEQIAVIASPAGVGLLTLVAALIPFPPRLRNGVLLTMGVLSLGALGTGLVFSAPMALSFLVLSGSLLAICAGTIPMVLRVVQ